MTRSIEHGALLVVGLALCLSLGSGVGASQRDAKPRLTSFDPAARLPSGDSAWEQWDLTARFDSGHYVFARFLITNVGPGGQNAAAVGHVIRPDGSVVDWDNGRRRRRWKLSSDRLYLDIGSSHLDLHPNAGRLDIGKKKKGVELDLRFTLRGRQESPAELLPGGYHLDLLDIGGPVEGSIWLEGMPGPLAVRGRMAVVHSWGTRSEADLILRRIEFFSLQAERSLYAIDLTTPQGKRKRWLAVTDGRGAARSTSVFEMALIGAAPGGAKTGYWVPGSLDLKGAQVEGQIRLDRILLERNPLSGLPQPFRFLASMIMHPHGVWARSAFEVALRAGPGAPVLRSRGTGVMAVNFLDRVAGP
jgi:hypothetical protein